jgi:hypothetical protein
MHLGALFRTLRVAPNKMATMMKAAKTLADTIVLIGSQFVLANYSHSSRLSCLPAQILALRDSESRVHYTESRINKGDA